MIFETTILGTSSAVIAHGRALTAQVLQADNRFYLIDCGEGTQFQLVKYGIRSSLLRCIFISHLHGDHYYGLMGLLTTMSLKGRENPLYVLGPAGLGEAIALHLRLSGSVLSYEIIFKPISEEGTIYEDELLAVDAVALDHKIPCMGFIFREARRARRLIGEKMPQGLPVEMIEQLKNGSDISYMGQTYYWKEMTQPPKPQRSYAFCSDTRYMHSLAPKIAGVDVLYHEATYLTEHAQKAADHFHSTAAQAAQVARSAGVKALIIGHYSSRYADLSPLWREANAIFAPTCLATEGGVYGMSWKGQQYEFTQSTITGH